MTISELQRAALVLFAVKEAHHTGSLPTMRAICYVIRNRVKAGWHDGGWLSCIEHAGETAGNLPRTPPALELKDKAVQIMCRDVDNIFYGTVSDEIEDAIGNPAVKDSRPAMYYQFLDRPISPWFEEHIIRDPAHHAIRARQGLTVFFE